MRHCLNPGCLHPSNPENHQFCVKCGQKLLLRERYWAKKILGQGGFGRTFLAVDEDKPSKPFCVIKQLLPQAQGTDSLDKAAELFAQEAEQLEQLGHHDQIPELLAYFTDNDQQYLVQEFVNGATLAQELADNGVFSERQIRELLIDILGILDFVHGKNVIHRDIKPENIIRRSSDQKLVLVDFGAAKVLQQVQRTVTGTIIGTAEYCAPEQAMGKAKFASDLYSLGVTCLHLLTQMSPFDLYDSNEMEWAWRDFLNGNAVSDELGQILDHLIQQAPKKRARSAQDVWQTLQPVRAAAHPSQISQTILSEPETQQSLVQSQPSQIPARYQRLTTLLKAGDWKGADRETAKQILAVANRTKQGWLNVDDIKHFPCEDLRAIDQLWVYYSQERFGFSIQKRIYQSLGGTMVHDAKVWNAFGDAVGWRKGNTWLYYKDLNFNTSSQEGHLPTVGEGVLWRVGGSVFFSRVETCGL
ncbi:serine/threonine-protein kinase [Spirulina major CS-329]|uniref:serine/threonine-protein kinase n=1 Tax=Spirulina TaxID=1154 RepID=UPI00232D98B7|nr:MULTISPECIES: serine/threonine-protein kinase [Spirulina]MDB9493982.1 serine/threonine-protein kinase [Spirulina subsalsa CS-330]MDB9502665.1 serine/threonine-protein kinase [Spirulina major CS-329]